MTERTCHNCVYSCCDPCRWLRAMWAGEPILPRCAHHPQWPGQLHDVPGVPCRNYRPKPPMPEGDVRMIPLGDGDYAYVDAADYEWLNQWNWHLDGGYAVRFDKGRRIFMHRQIMQPPEGMVVHHRDGNKANNCRRNLCVCTPRENTRNKRKHRRSLSVFKGVFYDKRCDKWYAKCQCDGKPRQLGYFDTEVEAARAYDRMAVESFGEFARLNFPQEWPPKRRAEVYAQRDAAKTEAKKVGQSTDFADSPSPASGRNQDSLSPSTRRAQRKKEGGCVSLGDLCGLVQERAFSGDSRWGVGVASGGDRCWVG